MKAELSKHNVELKCLLLLVGDDAKQHWVLKIENLYFDPAMMFIKRKLNKKYAGVLAELVL